MDHSEMTLQNWHELVEELGDISEFAHFVNDRRSAQLHLGLKDLSARLAREELPGPDQAISDLALLRKAYTHKQSLTRLKAS